MTYIVPAPIRVALIALVLVAAVYDFRSRRIQNWLNLSGLILGFGLNALFFHFYGTAKAAEGMLLALAVYFPLYLLRGMGAGDVKLMAAVGSLVGPGNWFEIFLSTALIGGAAAALFALIKGRLTQTLCNLYFLVKDLLCLRAPYRANPQLDFRAPSSLSLPHGVLIALGFGLFLALTLMGNKSLSTVLSNLITGIF